MNRISKQITVFCIIAIFLNLIIVRFCAFKINDNEIKREKADVETLNDIQNIFSDILKDDELWQYLDDDVIKYKGQTFIYIGNGKDGVQFDTIKKWYPNIYKKLPIDRLKKEEFTSQSCINSSHSLYLIVYYDRKVTVMLSDDGKSAIGCRYIDDYFITD